MLNLYAFSRQAAKGRHGQRGVVLLFALIVLVAMTLAGIALVRSTDLANIIAGNLAFRQAATHSGDIGIETAFAWLQNNAAGNLLYTDQPDSGYSADGNNPARSPATGQSWEAYWATLPANRIRTLSEDGAGNTVSYTIDRMCSISGPPQGASCTSSTVASASGGGDEQAGEAGITGSSATYYRITVRISGPRRTISYVQAVVAM